MSGDRHTDNEANRKNDIDIGRSLDKEQEKTEENGGRKEKSSFFFPLSSSVQLLIVFFLYFSQDRPSTDRIFADVASLRCTIGRCVARGCDESEGL